MVALLPHLEGGPLSKQFDANKGYAGNHPAAGTPFKVFVCPAGTTPAADAATHYVALAGVVPDAASQPFGAAGNGFMGWDRPTAFAMIKDGSSNTVALIETRSGLGPWARGGASTVRGFDPGDVPVIGDGRPFGGHPGVAVVAMADGSTRVVRASVDPARLAAAVTIAGGESPADLD